jgi:CDGSH-type Zn-finger protein
MTDLPKITPTPDGPLIVAAPPRLTGANGATLETGAKVALCRCGASSRKPFCDGSHARIGFDGALDRSRPRNAPRDYVGEVEGEAVTISYTPVLCTHAARCQAGAAAVFDPARDPWIEPGRGRLDEILAVVAACPSGALRVGVELEAPRHITPDDAAIEIERDGPFHVRNVALEAEFDGAGASRAKYSLCRCGLSRNKPFCDGSHHDAGWSDERSGDAAL